MHDHLLLLLEAPLQSWGGIMVDAYGPTDPFPPATLVEGLLANALGYDRCDAAAHEALQRRLVMGTVVMQRGESLTDQQNAKLGKNDTGWTTRGRPEGRAGGADSYNSPHRRFRDYHADALALVALRVDQPDEAPDLDAVERALTYPERPLFLGRKPCLPSRRIVFGRALAPAILDALQAGAARVCEAAPRPAMHLPALDGGPWRARWPQREGRHRHDRLVDVCEDRDFRNGVHVGLRRRREAEIYGQPGAQS